MNFTLFILANFYLGCWVLLYYLAFSKKTTFGYNRMMLLTGIVLSFLLPFINFPPIILFSSAGQPVPVITATGGSAMIIPDPAVSRAAPFPVWNMLIWIYWSGVVLMGISFLGKLAKIMRYLRKFPHNKHNGYIHVQTPDHWEVFSFMYFLFAPINTAGSILEHEKVHIRQRHSIDNLFTEGLKIFCWFNPATYFCQKALRMEHEYLADAATIKVVDVKEYAQKLVSQSFRLSNLSIVHPFLNRSHLQKRLIMLQKRQKPFKGAWTYLLLFPVLTGIVLFTSSFSVKDKLQGAVSAIRPAHQETGSVLSSTADTTIEGTIHSPSGEPITEANITIEGTTRGTSTDQKGHFIFPDIAQGSILHISSIGYNSITIQVSGNKDHLDIILYPKPKALNKLVVTGYTNDTLPSPSASDAKNASASDNNNNMVFQFVEQMPQFPGGQDALMKYLATHVKYPQAARENGIQGTVVVQFIVQKDGSITSVKTLGNKKGGLEEEAMRVVKQMPEWIPGKQNNKKVRVQFSLPIRFQLKGPVKEQQSAAGNPPPPPAPPAPHPVKKPAKGEVYSFVEQMPQFPGGQDALMKYLSQNIKYPAEARENGIQGTIIVSFVVQKDGSLTNIHTIGKKKGNGLEEEAMRVVKQMPEWVPGKQDDKPVKVQYSLPIRFKLQ